MHITVRETRPPRRESVVVAQLFPIVNEPAPESRFSRINIEPEDLADPVEAKVVKAHRGRRPVITAEVAETK